LGNTNVVILTKILSLDEPYHKYGRPLNVLKFSDDDKIIIQNEELKEILNHPDVKFRKIVPFSIIGAYRKGKSFFLDYCLRFLYAHVKYY